MKSPRTFSFRLLPALFLFFSNIIVADAQETVLTDKNGDGIVSALAFGDSITFGIGDAPGGGGYPARFSSLLKIPVENEGAPGEEFLSQGISRFPFEVQKTTADVIVFLEGANDAVKIVGIATFRNAVQRIVNVSRALNREVILGTPQRPTGDTSALAPFAEAYANAVRDVANANNLRVADFELAWRTTCTTPTDCELYNLPEGLHPNKRGYDVMAQVLAAAALGIDVFAVDGAAQLEAALGLEAGTVLVKPRT